MVKEVEEKEGKVKEKTVAKMGNIKRRNPIIKIQVQVITEIITSF